MNVIFYELSSTPTKCDNCGKQDVVTDLGGCAFRLGTGPITALCVRCSMKLANGLVEAVTNQLEEKAKQ